MIFKYEIRKMGENGIRHGYFCGGTSGRITCVEKATLYLVRRPEAFRQGYAESRSRRCKACAEIDAKSLRIPMPEQGGK